MIRQGETQGDGEARCWCCSSCWAPFLGVLNDIEMSMPFPSTLGTSASSATFRLRQEGLPVLGLWMALTGRPSSQCKESVAHPESMLTPLLGLSWGLWDPRIPYRNYPKSVSRLSQPLSSSRGLSF